MSRKFTLIPKILILLLAFPVIAAGGCGRQTTSDSPQSTETVLTLGMIQSSQITDFDSNYLTNTLEERANVDLKLVLSATNASEFEEKLSLMIRRKEKLPDIILLKLDSTSAQSYGENGIFLPLTQYFNNPDAMPIFHQIPKEDREKMISQSTLLNSEIYGAPAYSPEIGNEYPYRAWINTTWLNTLGLSIPTTTEELYNTLKAFKEKDPNGNGQADEIPMLGAINGWARDPVPFLMNAFTYADIYAKYLAVESGTVYPSYTTNEWKEGLAFINKLVTEDLLSPLSFTQNHNQMDAILNSEKEQYVGCFMAGSMSLYTLGSQNSHDMDILPPLTGPNGACYAVYYPDSVDTNRCFITKDCTNIEAAVRLLDTFYDREVSAIARLGEPEVDWTTDTGEAISPYANLGVSTGYVEINTIWGQSQSNQNYNKIWGSMVPRYIGALDSYSIQGKGASKNTDPSDPTLMTPKSIPYYIDKHPEEIAQNLLPSPEESAEYANLEASIWSYVTNATLSFIVGETPLSEWDNYIDTLQDLGLKRYMELAQNAFDRKRK